MARILWGSVSARLSKLLKIAFFAVGPIFITVGFAIIAALTYMYFLVTLPYHYGGMKEGDFSIKEKYLVRWWLHTIFGVYLLINIVFNYYMAAVSDPGRTCNIVWDKELYAGEQPPKPPTHDAYEESDSDDDHVALDVMEDKPPIKMCHKCVSNEGPL
ncbi:hypothetical protein HDU97_003492 [Phlyctochytrium planicorne]|nr:hypothetical protein HDU97_003492 [Phlyctochytrium planicorne]